MTLQVKGSHVPMPQNYSLAVFGEIAGDLVSMYNPGYAGEADYDAASTECISNLSPVMLLKPQVVPQLNGLPPPPSPAFPISICTLLLLWPVEHFSTHTERCADNVTPPPPKKQEGNQLQGMNNSDNTTNRTKTSDAKVHYHCLFFGPANHMQLYGYLTNPCDTVVSGGGMFNGE